MFDFQDLLVEQSLSEAELREEVAARIAAEKRLRAAQDCVVSLQQAIDDAPAMSPEAKKEFIPHVTSLKGQYQKLTRPKLWQIIIQKIKKI